MAKIAYCHNFELWQKKVIYGLKKTYGMTPGIPGMTPGIAGISRISEIPWTTGTPVSEISQGSDLRDARDPTNFEQSPQKP